ncbi:MAG: hypothetical protein IKL35_08910 [Muribaculaceae bacterium]|nr:hypothetical protein [Muribaculaceae bacterium]
MNAKRILYLGMLCLMAIMTSCSNDDEEPIWNSPVPYGFEIILVDEEGNNLLTDDNISSARNNIYIVYDEDVYKLDYEVYNPKMTFKGFELPDGGYRLSFGGFWGDYEDETFVICYGDENQDEISFTSKNYDIKEADGKPFECIVKVNGEIYPEVFGYDITLKLNPNR